MEQEKSPELLIEACLKQLGITSLGEWDVLFFLHRHQTSLVNAEQLARLLGYPSKLVCSALDALESRGLVQRSRVSQTFQIHRLTDSDKLLPPADLRELMTLAGNREGRLLLLKKMRDHTFVAREKDILNG